MTAQPTKTLLIVHHTPSPHTQEMFEAVVSGASDPEIEGVDIVRRPALDGVSRPTCSRPTAICSDRPPIWVT